jgi:hypothetical protein
MSWRFIREWARTVAIAAAIPAAGAVLLLAAKFVGSSDQLVESVVLDESSAPRLTPESIRTKWWEGAGGALLAALLGALIGSCVPLYVTWRARWIEREGELVAMRDEMGLARWAAEELINNRQTTIPGYHPPLTMIERALPKLIGDGLLTDEEIRGLVEYVARADGLNRGLDRVGQIQIGTLDTANERLRNTQMALSLIKDPKKHLGGRTVQEAAKRALARLIRESKQDWRMWPTRLIRKRPPEGGLSS